jgi:Na+-translocating ferredoxin:NAD+ oxidoreductase RnfD subunit
MSASIHESRSITTLSWIKTACLLPALLMLFYVHGPAFIKVFLITASLCFAIEKTILLISKQESSPTQYGDLVLHVIILSLCLPLSATLWLIAMASLACVALSRALFGIFGQHIFHPAMLGAATAFIATREHFNPLFLTEHSFNPALFFLILVPGFFLLLRKLIPNEAPVAFMFTSMVIYGLCILLVSYWPNVSISLPAFHQYFAVVMLLGMFVITDLPIGGIDARSRTLVGISAASLVFVCYLLTNIIASFACAIILCNFMTPWFEQLSRSKLS